MKFVHLLFVLFIGIFAGCKSPKTVIQEPSPQAIPIIHKPVFLGYYPNFTTQSLSDSIQKASTKNTYITRFYKKNQYVPVWITDTLDLKPVSTLLDYLSKSDEHGINPEYFGTKHIQAIFDSIRTGNFNDNDPLLYKALLDLEQSATKAAIDYAFRLKYGFIQPEKLLPQDYFIPVQKPDTTYYNTLYAQLSVSPEKLLASAQPTDSTYIQLQKTLLFYKTLKDSSAVKISSKEKNGVYKPDEKDKNMALIAKRLMLTNELPYTSNPDSMYATLTPELLEAVNGFRESNSYPRENEIGKITIEALNRPLSYYYKLLQANLERYRWKRITPTPDKFSEVNVAAFTLKNVEKGKKTMVMNVCVGKSQNHTPLLQGELNSVILNPTWSVPSSIIEKEIYSLIKNDSTYLGKQGMKLIKNGETIDPQTIDWNTVDPKKFPYQIRQDSGNGNALGRIKFMFKNPFSVYLHDTPSKRAFLAKNRAVSHGCVRLQRPVDMAFFCMEGIDSVYFDRIRYTIDQPPVTAEGKALLKNGQLKKVQEVIGLKKSIPLFIDYFTAYTLPESNRLYFADDVYLYDEKIIQELGRLKVRL